MKLQNTCARCAFFRKPDGAGADTNGACHRNPPTVVLMSDPSPVQSVRRAAMGFAAVHPVVHPDDWCGEFRQAQGLQSVN